MALSWFESPRLPLGPSLHFSRFSALRGTPAPDLVRFCVPGMGLDQGEVGEAHGLVSDGGGPGTRLAHKAAGLPGK